MRSESTAEQHQLRVELGRAVTDVLGVARVEPTLRSALAAVTAGAGQALIGRGSPGEVSALGIDVDTRVDTRVESAADGIALTGISEVAEVTWTDVTVDIATWPTTSAVHVARAAREAVRGVLIGLGRTPGRIVINVMDISAEHGTSEREPGHATEGAGA